jgi:hypothetical protein
MKDLYKRADINALGLSVEDVKEKLGSNGEVDEDVSYVLLNPSRKPVYDRAHRTANIVGSLRYHYGLGESVHWGREFGDFTNAPCLTPNDSSMGKNPYNIVELKYLMLFLPILFLSAILIYGVFKNYPSQDISEVKVQPKSNHSAQPVIAIDPIGKFVTASKLNIRSLPNAASKVITILSEYDDVFSYGSENDGWDRVVVDGKMGYASAKYLQIGDGRAAYLLVCSVNSTGRPTNGKYLYSESGGNNTLEVVNSPGQDTVVKLKDRGGRIVLYGYVRSGESATFTNIPDGDYKFQYASGINFSTYCDMFMQDMMASTSTSYEEYSSTGSRPTIITYKLIRLAGGNFRSSKLVLSDF